MECERKLGATIGEAIWELVNMCFDWMPVAAVIEEKIFCVHGGVGGVCS
jgi:protein phosphatase